MKRLIFSLTFILSVLFFASPLFGEVKTARIFGSNMVLQQNAMIPVWGWADPGEKVTVVLDKDKATAKAGKDGKWMVKLNPLQAGGPYVMTVKGKNTITFNNVLIGEVWVCSGQSNMEFKVSQGYHAEQEAASANYPKIRFFTVAKKIGYAPLKDLDQGEWVECSPETAPDFSAVGYFFGRELYKNLDVPVGLIHSSWGGTNIESWTSAAAMDKIDDFSQPMAEERKVNPETIQKNIEEGMKTWTDQVQNQDAGKINKWEYADLADTDWPIMPLPTLWENAGLPDFDGVVWFRKTIQLNASDLNGDAVLSLGPIDDSDDTYVNGTKIGSTWEQYDKRRIYKIPKGLLHAGTNVIAVKVIDSGGGGGIWGESKQMYLDLGTNRISLAGNWKYKVGIKTKATAKDAGGPNSFPTLLYNGMIYPIIPYAIKGVIWYQGENNAGRAYQYRTLFPAMISDWRNNWGEGNFPFLFVQLANFMAARENPSESTWAELREAQTMTLSLPNTGMALAIDIGDAADIHPKNKQDVGKRLALCALNIAYGKEVIYSGPVYQSLKVEGDKAVITFSNTGKGLVVHDKYGYVKGFALAGDDKKFYWAKGEISGNKVILQSNRVKNPVAVRYAWADNPDDADLYNEEGLPAVPFRTDQWKGITFGVK